MAWDPNQYLKFAGHRLRPALDLLARVDLDDPREVYDLGAGAGNVTRVIGERWPNARITGVDESEAMLDKARAAAPAIAWQRADLATWSAPRPADLIYSNAALHWLDGHERVFPRLVESLAPGGVLAVQMPRNFGEPSHTSIYETVRAGAWRARLEPLIRAEPTAPGARYREWLLPHVRALDIWETVYLQVLSGDNPVAEFVKGSWLTQFLGALDGAEREAFETAYRERVRPAYPPGADGRTLFPFRRLFIVAQR